MPYVHADGSSINDEAIIGYVVDALDDNYQSFLSYLHFNSAILFDDLVRHLLEEEDFLKHTSTAVAPPAIAFATRQQSSVKPTNPSMHLETTSIPLEINKTTLLATIETTMATITADMVEDATSFEDVVTVGDSNQPTLILIHRSTGHLHHTIDTPIISFHLSFLLHPPLPSKHAKSTTIQAMLPAIVPTNVTLCIMLTSLELISIRNNSI